MEPHTGGKDHSLDPPKRERRLPSHLDDYEVQLPPTLLPLSGEMAAAAVPSPRRSSHCSKSGSSCSTNSKVSGSRHSTTSRSPRQGLSNIQLAMLDERLKVLELEELQRQIEEDSIADLECRKLDAQAKEAQRLQEEASKAREALVKQLSIRRRLSKVQNELEAAKMVTTFLKQDSQEMNLKGDSGSTAGSDVALPFVDSLPQRPAADYHRKSPFAVNPDSIKPELSWTAAIPSTSDLLHSRPVTQLGPPTVATQSTLPLSSVPLTSSNPHQAASAYNPAPTIGLVNVARGPPQYFQSTLAPSTGSAGSQPKSRPVLDTGQHGPFPNPQPNASLIQPHLPQTHPANMEMLVSSAYGIPKPVIPCFESGRESDFALLKMALDNLMSDHQHLSEQYKYQVLLGQLKLPSALQLAKAFMHDPRPYTAALQALQDKYGQPRQLVQCELGAILNAPAVKFGDAEAFDAFALSVYSLVGMLRALEGQNGYELRCGSHVDRLLSKMPPSYRDSFVEYCFNRGILQTGTDRTYSLLDLSTWLQMKSQAKRISNRAAMLYQCDTAKPTKKEQRSSSHPKERSASILYTADAKSSSPGPDRPKSTSKFKPYCPYCDNKDHFLNSCPQFKVLPTGQITRWIAEGNRCWKCGRAHAPDSCTLKRPCKTCNELHLTILHEAAQQSQRRVLMVNCPVSKVYLDQPNRSQKVMLKVVKVLLHNGNQSMETFAVLDDGSERSIILPQAVKQLKLATEPETLTLRTIRQDVVQLHGASVSLCVSPKDKPSKKFQINHAFTAADLALSEHSYPIAALQRKYEHIRTLPLSHIDHAQPLLLIGSDMPHLLTPIQPACVGPPCGPVAICTRLGWTLQGPTGFHQTTPTEHHCLHIATASSASELLNNVERLWQIDTLPYVNERTVTRSKQDHFALSLLQTQTERIEVDGVQRYATPLLRRPNASTLNAPKEAVLASLRNTERRLTKDPKRAEAYSREMQKLQQAGYVTEITPKEAEQSTESWYIPHHMVCHNGKDRIVFNCSFQYQGESLNDQLLPGPTLGSSLLGVLLRFREHSVAVSGDVRGMFHQVRLLPSDKPLLRFIWRNMERTEQPKIYEWQVLPFGTTCSPCCAIYALQRLVQDHASLDSDLMKSVEQSFYVDNCLQSLQSVDDAKALVDGLRHLLLEGGFELRQWASNRPEVIEHLPLEARSQSSELWLSITDQAVPEGALGLQWNCLHDTLGYKLHPMEQHEPTLRHIYKVLASQYDPLGYLIPFTTRAKILIQDVWKEDIGWDDLIQPQRLLARWNAWKQELPDLEELTVPRCYTPSQPDTESCSRDLHIFCDASERAYGSVAYMRTIEGDRVRLSFVFARSRVAPKKQASMPRLELSAALTGAQVSKLLLAELTVPIRQVILWSDSTTVLHWIHSESCRYKVFVGTRVAEIQTITDVKNWRYVDSLSNPADDITRGKSLKELAHPQRWILGPEFLYHPETFWPTMPVAELEPDSELRKSALCLHLKTSSSSDLPDFNQFDTWKGLVKATVDHLNGAAHPSATTDNEAANYIAAEKLLLRQAQKDSFPEEVKACASNQPLPSNSCLASLSPEYDNNTGLIRVGGRLRRAEGLELDAIHPVVLDPKHPVTKLLIKEFDAVLLHPGPERVLAELRRHYWVLRGREAIKKLQHTCIDCQKWRAQPQIPKMADLPPARLRLYKPPFYSTGMDCFGPFFVKIGRRTEKRWGIVYKCMTTRCLHLDLLESLDTDAFLMSLRRFVARRGKPFELLSDNGTNFVGGDRELEEAYMSMTDQLKAELAEQKIAFRFNPPSAPHFGGTWEREVKSVKTALKVILKDQTVSESVLRTVLIEIESIMNAKPLGYISSDVADPDPITPNLLLMGRHDSSLPQVIYDSSELLGRRRWRHSQILADHFWSRFIRQYLPSFQERQKWRKDSKDLQAGQVVLIVDPQLPRALWPVGKVTCTYPGSDGRIRTAAVQVKDRIYLRPVARLVPLPKLPDDIPDPAT